MNKNELIEQIAVSADITKAKAGLALEAFIEAVTTSLQKGEDVSLVGFGTFTVSERSERTGRNPQTGETIKIAACKQPKFRAGKKTQGCCTIINSFDDELKDGCLAQLVERRPYKA